MSQPNESNEVGLDYNETLKYSQRLRRQIVENFISPDGKVTTDAKELDTVLKALKDMDQTALQDRKNQIDQSGADSSKEVAEAMRDLLAMQMNKNPFQRQPDGTAVPAPLPSIDKAKLGDHLLVKGEEEIGVITETSADFMKRMEEQRAQNSTDD